MELSHTKTHKHILIFVITFILVACSESVPTEPYPYTELALEPGMIIEATNKNGTVIIEYLSPLERRYKWGKHDEKRTLIPRKERWLGQLGAYDPATTYILSYGPRIVAEDSQMHFESMDEVKAQLYESSAVLDWVYTDNGLVIGFAESQNRNQVNIEVYQYYINGQKPTKLEGSRPENIKIKRPNNALNRTD